LYNTLLYAKRETDKVYLFFLFIYFIFATNTRKYMSAKTGNTAKQGIVKICNWYLQ